MTFARATFALAVLFAGHVTVARSQEPPSHAQMRWNWFMEQRRFPAAQIPEGALDRARGQLSSMRASARASVTAIGGSRWDPIGPTSINGTAIGRLTTIAIHPTNSNIIYIGGAQGGVWKTVDGGDTWVPLTDTQCSLAMGSIAIDPVNPNIVYAGTGELHFSADSYYGCGVLRSTDAGATWTRVGGNTFVNRRIARLLIAPSTAGTVASTTLYAAADNGFWRSADGGDTWTVLRTGNPVPQITDVAVDPTNDAIVYIAINLQGVFRSADRGTTWETLGAGFPTASVGRINISVAPAAPTTLYAAVQSTANNQLLGVWKSSSSGAGWTQLGATGVSCNDQCWYDMYVAVSPADPNIVYFGGLSLYRSVDGGQSFANVGTSIHSDQHVLVFDPQDPARVFAGNDGGIYRSNNGTSGWVSLNNGLALTQFYGGISLHPSSQTIIIAGTQDNGTLAYTGSPGWTGIIGGDGGFTAISTDNTLVRFGETQWTVGSTSSGPRRSDGGTYNRKVNGINTNDNAQFIPPLVMDANDSRVLYFGTDKVYRTLDAAESWSVVSPAFTGTIKAIAPAPSDAGVIYAGTSVGQLQVTTNGGAVWTLRTASLPVRAITDIAVDRADALTAYVTVSGFGTGHVFRTVNGGVSWSNVSANLPDSPVNAVITDPAGRGVVMIGTDLGVFISSDSGRAWSPITDGLPNVAVFDLAYNPATAVLIAATHGRGMFRLQLDRALTLALVPRKRRLDLLAGTVGTRADSAAVLLTGNGAATATWTAGHTAAPWLSLTTSVGAFGGTLRWSRNITGLAAGTYVDTITVITGGAIDSPARLVDSLVIVQAAIAISPPTHFDAVPAGTTQLRPDSAALTVIGTQSPWTAVASKGTWLTITTLSGVGNGVLRWSRNPVQLPIGVYVDTITVSAAAGGQATVIDSMRIQPALAVAFASRRDTLVSATQVQAPVTAALTVTGDVNSTTAWTAVHGNGTWLTITNAFGRGAGQVAWTTSAYDLRDGVYVDTITITAPNAAAVRIVETLVVVAPAVTTQCVVDHFFGAPCLDAPQARWMDLAGNHDGAYNLGDLLAYLARPGVVIPAAFRKGGGP